jgi:hypothetical protein
VAELDYSELVGFQFGKNAAIQRWRDRKEAREFSKLCDRLRTAKRVREIKAAKGPRLEAFVATHSRCTRSWYRRNKAKKAAQVKAWRVRKRIEKAEIIACRGGCGATWCPVPTRGTGPFVRYCSDRCRNRAKFARAKERGDVA